MLIPRIRVEGPLGDLPWISSSASSSLSNLPVEWVGEISVAVINVF